MSAGWGYTCGLRGDGGVECWRWGTGSKPGLSLTWNSINLTWDLEREKEILNLDWDSSPQAAEAPKGEFIGVSAGREAACGLRPGGSVECWGNNRVLSDSPEGVFAAVSAGIEHACGLRLSGRVECWGSSTSRGNATSSPGGEYTDISIADASACGIRENDGKVECWRAPYHSKITPPQEPLINISAGWGGYQLIYGAPPNVSPPYHIPSPPVYIENDWGYSCGLRPDHTVKCWGDTTAESLSGQRNWAEVLDSPVGEFTEVQAGRRHACGLRLSGKIECWGSFSYVREENYTRAGVYPASDRTDIEGYAAFSVGGTHTCGLTHTGSIECWDDAGNNTFLETGPFTAVSAGYDHQCGLRTTGDIRCWAKKHRNSSYWRNQTYTPTDK